MTTLSDYKSIIKSVARTNRFEVNIQGGIPGDCANAVGLDLTNFKFYVTKISIPKIDISGPVVKFKGSSLIIQGDYKKEPLNISLWNDEENKARSFFETWMQKITNIDTNVSDSIANKDLVLQ